VSGDSFFAWRGAVRKRQSADLSVLDDPLVREAWECGHEAGMRAGFLMSADFAGLPEKLERLTEVLQGMQWDADREQLFRTREEASVR